MPQFNIMCDGFKVGEVMLDNESQSAQLAARMEYAQEKRNAVKIFLSEKSS